MRLDIRHLDNQQQNIQQPMTDVQRKRKYSATNSEINTLRTISIPLLKERLKGRNNSSQSRQPYFDKREGSYQDISDYVLKSQRFIVTRSTLREAMKQVKATAKSLAAIDFSTEERQGFVNSLKEDFP